MYEKVFMIWGLPLTKRANHNAYDILDDKLPNRAQSRVHEDFPSLLWKNLTGSTPLGWTGTLTVGQPLLPNTGTWPDWTLVAEWEPSCKLMERPKPEEWNML